MVVRVASQSPKCPLVVAKQEYALVTVGVLTQCSVEEHALVALDLYYLLADVHSVASAEVGQKGHL